MGSLLADTSVREFLKLKPFPGLGGVNQEWLGALFWTLLIVVIKMLMIRFIWNHTLVRALRVGPITLLDAFALSTILSLL